LFGFASSKGIVEEGERMVVQLCDRLMISLTAMVAELWARESARNELECVELFAGGAERRMAGMRVEEGANSVEVVKEALSDLWGVVVLATAGQALIGGVEGNGRARVGDGETVVPATEHMLSGLLVNGKCVKL
jgi:hypothetical protein